MIIILKTIVKSGIKLFQPQSLNSITISFGWPLLAAYSCNRNENIRSISAKLKVPVAKCKINNDRSGFDPHKARLILSLNFRCAEDAVPFYKLPINSLLFVQKVTFNDASNGFCDNRLYYISSKIQCPPAILSENLARRIFVYRLSFDWLERSLNELLDKGVSGDRILRDLWVLKYHHKTIGERLQRIKDMGIENLFPWMVRCSPDILNRYMNITKETKKILGNTKSTKMYLAERLKISVEDVEEMCIRLPALKTIRVTKVKKFLDFLIDKGYGVEEIANKPRILASSQKTVEQRLKQLHQLGLTNINLNILCRSRKDYQRFHDSLNSKAKDCNVI